MERALEGGGELGRERVRVLQLDGNGDYSLVGCSGCAAEVYNGHYQHQVDPRSQGDSAAGLAQRGDLPGRAAAVGAVPHARLPDRHEHLERQHVSFGWASVVAGWLVWRRAPAVAAAVLWIEAANAAMHAGMAVRKRRYNPGVVSVALLMGPHASAGTLWIARSPVPALSHLLAASAGLAFAGLPLAMKLRMRRTHA